MKFVWISNVFISLPKFSQHLCLAETALTCTSSRGLWGNTGTRKDTMENCLNGGEKKGDAASQIIRFLPGPYICHHHLRPMPCPTWAWLVKAWNWSTVLKGCQQTLSTKSKASLWNQKSSVFLYINMSAMEVMGCVECELVLTSPHWFLHSNGVVVYPSALLSHSSVILN